ncbi:hypothetical protein [Allorhizobium borbori]|uniref:Uncharacterized protein n=1 Tax=Allorhizobium borbori TaxID=485907 RepID=A0A7W6K1S5_9HYPH|nr:hypothetical protein [Allorhizobium borbori]MBB4103586.1 hypothetical protein [Allorhizobium borbori]
MTATDEQRALIDAITKHFAVAEAGLNDAVKALHRLEVDSEDAARLKLEGATGSFVVKFRAEVRQLIGQIGAIEAPLYGLHVKATAIARNTDEAYKAPDNYVTLLGGGR